MGSQQPLPAQSAWAFCEYMTAAGAGETDGQERQTWRPPVVSAATAAAVRHRLIRLRNDRNGSHASSECERQNKNQEKILHDRLPSPITPSPCQNWLVPLLGATCVPEYANCRGVFGLLRSCR